MAPEVRPIDDAARLREEVRQRYAAAAVEVSDPGTVSCCSDDEGRFGQSLYGVDLEGVPDAARLASLGCGNPVAVAELHGGETVLDLGSGGGLDVVLSARRVGPSGRVYGLDMTDEMLDLARRTAAEAGLSNVIFLRGLIEAVPLPAASVDVIISNCVLNLSTDKPRVMAEMARVLRSGGRLGLSDVVADDDLTATERAERGSFVGCVAGALSFAEYAAGLVAAGFTDVSVTPTHAVAEGLSGAIIRAVRGDGGRVVSAPRATADVPVLTAEAAGCGCGCAADDPSACGPDTGCCQPGSACC